MKIYFISKDASWQKYRLEVLDKLAQNYNHNIEILTTGVVKEYLAGNERIKYITFRSMFPQKWGISFMPGILIYILRNKPDAILALNNVRNITEYFSIILSKICNIKFIWWTHGYDHKKKKIYTEIKRIYVLFFLRLANSIIIFSKKGEEYLLGKGLSADKLFVAPNTLDTSKIFKLKELIKVSNYNEICKNLTINPNNKILLFCGRLNKRKKIYDAIEALKIVERKINNVKLVLIGGGGELGELKRRSVDSSFRNILVLGEIQDDLLLNQWFSIAKLFIIPRCVGLSIVQAFCYSLPLITEKGAGHGPEIQYLKDGINGYMVEENNTQQLADRIIELLLDETKRVKFANNALQTAQNEANIFNMINMMNLAITRS